jgi:hypothetical protein
MGRSRMAWRSQMGRVLVGWSLVGRLWNRSLLGVYPRWLGLGLLIKAPRKAKNLRQRLCGCGIARIGMSVDIGECLSIRIPRP